MTRPDPEVPDDPDGPDRSPAPGAGGGRDTGPDPAAPDTVSIVIPCYNAARFLPRAVASALAQTGIAPPQVVLVDDGSTDDTARIMADLAARHPTVEAHANPRNMGPAATRNHAIRHATGTWIAVLDADDAYLPDRMARLVAVARRDGLDAVADLPIYYDLAADCRAPEQMPAPGGVTVLGFADFLGHDADTGLDLGLLKPVFHRDLRERGLLRYPEQVRHGEDCALYVALTRAGARFGLLREAHYLFSTRVGAVSGRFSPGSVTAVDYLSLARQADGLRATLAAEGALDADIDRLLDARKAHALQLNRRYGWTLLRKAQVGRLRFWLRQDPANGHALWRILRAKLAGHRGLPD